MSTHILQPADAMQAHREAPFALPPEAATLFLRRAERFRELAVGHDAPHGQADWLRFLAELSAAQHAALSQFAGCELPSPELRQQARQHLMPPLAVASLARDPVWQAGLRTVVHNLQKNWPNAAFAASATLERLGKLSSPALETLADRVLDHELTDDADRAASVFVAAALQVYWTVLAGRIDGGALVRLDNKGLCPCCGSLPVASVVRVGGEVQRTENLRYLHCSLCNTEWNLVRVACASCGNNAGIAYLSLHGHHPAVRAETCESCLGYLKIIYQEQDPQADPVADDLATLALDLLVDEAGYERAGPNLFILSGD